MHPSRPSAFSSNFAWQGLLDMLGSHQCSIGPRGLCEGGCTLEAASPGSSCSPLGGSWRLPTLHLQLLIQLYVGIGA